MFRLLVALLAIGAVLPIDAFAQAAQPSVAECEALGKYRDTGLYAQWSSVVGKSGTYAQAMKGLDEAYADVKSTNHELNKADLVGTFAHVADTTSTLYLNLAGAPYKALQRAVVRLLTDGKFVIDVYAAPNNRERILMLAQYMNDIALSATAVGRGAIAVRDLALDMKSLTDDMAESSSIHRQLNQRMSDLRRDAAQLQSKIATVDASLASLSGLKDAIDQACGIRGCPISGSATVSRKGALMCLVSSQASCSGCKDGWRHRCQATTTGLAWHPVDECLPNEMRNVKAGTDRQQVASALFAAQSDALASSNPRADSPRSSTSVVSAAAIAKCGEQSPDVSDLLPQLERAQQAMGTIRAVEHSQIRNGLSTRRTISWLLGVCDFETCVRLAREQIAISREATRDCRYSDLHQAACNVQQILVESSQRQLDWLLCYKAARS